MERSLRGLHSILAKLDDADRVSIENALTRMSTALGKRFLHHPMQRLKDLGNEGEGGQLAEIAELFGVGTTLLEVPEDSADGTREAESGSAASGSFPAKAVGSAAVGDEN